MSDTAGTVERIDVDLASQVMTLNRPSGPWLCYRVSTASAGAGQQDGSGGTPLGQHRIRACVGAGQPRGAVFRGRRPTGEIWTSELHCQYPGRDWILTRILWLCGDDPGYNRGGCADTMRRFIYIHGTPDTEPMGQPLSHGCIRMRNDDILQLWEWVYPGMPVIVH
ncbi:L,D-transpeptidase [Salicola sp. Rm-C-2C1-2]|uniref:L,D-transpeptidase n=1 Tax=Salicola sp. Rm-C-2C1-2 TaxID=3141321 RepID=UPI0032E411B2